MKNTKMRFLTMVMSLVAVAVILIPDSSFAGFCLFRSFIGDEPVLGNQNSGSAEECRAEARENAYLDCMTYGYGEATYSYGFNGAWTGLYTVYCQRRDGVQLDEMM